ncbi:DUF4384 domain-containing protein [Deinococcus maricopensis]|uniref:PEGA domain protein n=1 Tax=Deinococcus maricopensis (strain DSM 21211 / LMG 22137 / NRRL B-23946 / LB-34) TaxID=709986 RepID=E8U5E3_DEIML|nr:DUF4384 domain-containing protein [Deinococcus maricopensis]ADV66282.1 PEGA domain protein [Deinococcus maricopensis DSM 21211]
MKKFILLPAALLTSGALAAPQISAQSIIVNPVQSDLAVRVWVNKDPAGNANPTYRIGEKITVSTTVNQDAYVYLFNVDARGEITQILPNRFSSGENFVKANTTKTFPAPGDNFTFDIDGPAGQNKVLAVASKTELNLDQITSFQGDASLATAKVSGQQNLAQALSIVVNPVPQNSWVTDTAFFSVADRAVSRTGRIFVGTNVSNAVVYLNNRQVGAANTTYLNLQPGTYRVKVAAPGYAPYITNVTVRADSTVNVNVQFTSTTTTTTPAPVANTARVTFRSNAEGARVFVDGREVGTIRGGALSVNLAKGSRDVTILAEGYRAFNTTYNVQNGGTITVNLTR